jgi:hypothetical protein
MLYRKIITVFFTEVYTIQKTHSVGTAYNIWTLNLAVYKAAITL